MNPPYIASNQANPYKVIFRHGTQFTTATTWNSHILHILENLNFTTANFWNFFFEFDPILHILFVVFPSV